MSQQLSASEQLTYSTTRIECVLNDGTVSTGTGFFFHFLKNEHVHVPVIVTNKHVVSGAATGRFLLHLAKREGEPWLDKNADVNLSNFEARWIPHPDPKVDLCIMPVGAIFEDARTQEKGFFTISIEKSHIPTTTELNELTALEDIIMIGYPNGIWDSHNNMPIIRKGITATHPALNYEGRSEFMIDAACFPGSSGSPVFLFNYGSYASKSGDIVIGSRVKFLGVLYAGPQYTVEGEVQVVNVPTQQKIVTFSGIPNNLGIVIRSELLLAFEDILKKLLANNTI